jgi:hypothetical protein
MFSSSRDVFEWLNKYRKGAPYYLHLLNLYWGEDGEDEVISRFKELAFNLKHYPNVIKELIRDLNWRPTLVGNAVVILLGERGFQSDLIWRLENWSWVAPQIAGGIALSDEGSAERELQRIIENASENSNPKTIMSTYSSLKFLESKTADEFEKTRLFEILKEKDSWDNSIKIAEQHWLYWKNVKPIN